MSPQDQLLSQVVLYIGLGIGALCLLVALLVQVRQYRTGRASRADWVGLVGVIVGILILTAYYVYWEPVGRGALAEKAVMSTLYVACSISILYRIVRFSVWTFTAAIGMSVRETVQQIGSAAGITLIILLIADILHTLPRLLWLQAVVLFVGTLLGLLHARPSRATNTGGTAPQEKESPIIRVG
ncbi:MAG: hypothetical protein NTU88_15175 [Armatimonadetes bacterium]|nr:hypothetical protein [Armatimonadota bacterium]